MVANSVEYNMLEMCKLLYQKIAINSGTQGKNTFCNDYWHFMNKNNFSY